MDGKRGGKRINRARRCHVTHVQRHKLIWLPTRARLSIYLERGSPRRGRVHEDSSTCTTGLKNASMNKARSRVPGVRVVEGRE